MKYLKYRVVINGSTVKWSGYVYATSQETAFDMACSIAEGMGGKFFDVSMCFPWNDEDE